MEYNIYLVCEDMQRVKNTMLTLSCFLRDKLPNENLHFCFMHIGSVESWADVDIDLDSWKASFDAMFKDAKFPRVTTFHMEGYESYEGAADMCYSLMKSAKGPSAVFIDLEYKASVMVAVSDRLVECMSKDAMDGCLIFCTQSEIVDECCRNGYESCRFLTDYEEQCAPYRVGLRERFLRALHLEG